MAKRILTEQEVQAIRLCCPDFRHLTTKRAAKVMEVSQRRVQQILQSAKKKTPQLFQKWGVYHRPKTIRYESWLDDKVVETF